jgi:curved DNA-binding protein CbpA
MAAVGLAFCYSVRMPGLTPEERSAIDDLSQRVETGDYYTILGVASDCSPGELKDAYYSLSRRFHPDRFYRREVGDLRGQLESVFTGINISFEVLSDTVQRRRFDLEKAKKEEGRQSLSERRGRSSAVRSTKTTPPQTAPPQTAPPQTAPPQTAPPQTAPKETPARPAEAQDLEPPPVEAPPAPAPEKPSKRRSAYARHRDRLRQSGERSTKERSTKERSTRPRRERSSQSDTASPSSKMAEAVRNKISARKDKATACYQEALKSIEEEDWGPAASSLYMAHQYVPKNAEYKALWEEVQVKANQGRAAKYIALAESAESFRNVREAMHNYQQATECDPLDGLAHFRFGQLLAEFSGDARSALLQFRHAVLKTPDNVVYRMALANLYVDQKMNKNAAREYQKALELDPKNKEAKNALRKLRF